MGFLLVRGARVAWPALVLFALATTAYAADWELDLDARLVSSDGRKSVAEGGLGTLRYGEDKTGLQLGRARVALSQPLGEVWSLRLDASSWGDSDKNPIDLTEAYLQFRPYPRSGFRLRVKVGAFYAPISLENRAPGWESPYTLSSSAINTWFAEELRTIGMEGQVDWLGTRSGHSFDLALTGGVLGWNDPAGAVLATRGFALDDRQTTLFGRVGRTSSPLRPDQLFVEIDHRAGYYAGIEARYFDRVVLRALHYDNRADPAAFSPSAKEFGWQTHFDSAGLRVEGEGGWTGIVQWLNGQTYVEPGGDDREWPFDAWFTLVSKQLFREHRLSVRYDDFEVKSDLPNGMGAQRGHAWTAAYVYEPGSHWRFTLEWLRVVSDSTNRTLFLGEPSFARETQLQLAVRYALGSLVK